MTIENKMNLWLVKGSTYKHKIRMVITAYNKSQAQTLFLERAGIPEIAIEGMVALTYDALPLRPCVVANTYEILSKR